MRCAVVPQLVLKFLKSPKGGHRSKKICLPPALVCQLAGWWWLCAVGAEHFVPVEGQRLKGYMARGSTLSQPSLTRFDFGQYKYKC